MARAKRLPSIIKKLVDSQTRLSIMADIAGCRVVLDGGLDDVYRLKERLATHHRSLMFNASDVYDYNTHPQPTGYRALHIHATRDQHRVEIQLRTRGQHSWAELVERWDRDTGQDAKHGNADEAALRSLSELAAELG
ncbi:RelA/SpoT domain-containing protein [Stackebrandtia soli]|uniref:RelA/SpoT domain-containing protein n=1 Tax=Stackebrandtia soli TaxID=1892856 RepID=UPI0039ED420B